MTIKWFVRPAKISEEKEGEIIKDLCSALEAIEQKHSISLFFMRTDIFGGFVVKIAALLRKKKC